MRLVLSAVLFTASLACKNPQPMHLASAAMEKAVNARLDRQLHTTLRKILAAQAYRSAKVESTSATLVSAR